MSRYLDLYPTAPLNYKPTEYTVPPRDYTGRTAQVYCEINWPDYTALNPGTGNGIGLTANFSFGVAAMLQVARSIRVDNTDNDNDLYIRADDSRHTIFVPANSLVIENTITAGAKFTIYCVGVGLGQTTLTVYNFEQTPVLVQSAGTGTTSTVQAGYSVALTDTKVPYGILGVSGDWPSGAASGVDLNYGTYYPGNVIVVSIVINGVSTLAAANAGNMFLGSVGNYKLLNTKCLSPSQYTLFNMGTYNGYMGCGLFVFPQPVNTTGERLFAGSNALVFATPPNFGTSTGVSILVYNISGASYPSIAESNTYTAAGFGPAAVTNPLERYGVGSYFCAGTTCDDVGHVGSVVAGLAQNMFINPYDSIGRCRGHFHGFYYSGYAATRTTTYNASGSFVNRCVAGSVSITIP